MNKKGISGVITAVLMILLVISAIGVLWVVINSFVTNNTSEIGSATACLSTQLTVLDNLVDTGTTVSVRRDGGSDDLSQIYVYVDDVIVSELPSTIRVGEVDQITVSALSAGQRVSVAAVIGAQTCGKSNEVIVGP